MFLRSLTLLIAVAFAVQAAPVPKGDKTTAEKVTGKWELVKSRGSAPSAKHIITFTKEGMMTIEVGAENPVKYSGKWKITENAIDYEMTFGDDHKTEKLDIKKLTSEEMKTTDPDGIEEEFRRVKE